MKKLLFFILIVASIQLYGQNPIPDSLSAHRTAIGLKLSLSGGTMTGNTILNDNVNLKFGTGSDYSAYYDASAMHFKGTGNLTIGSTSGGVINFSSTITEWIISGSALYPNGDGINDIGTSTYRAKEIFADELTVTDSIKLGDAWIGETELEGIDGLTATSTDLNKSTWLDDTTVVHRSDINTNETAIALINSTLGGEIQDSIQADVRFFSSTITYPTSSENVALFRCPTDIRVTAVYGGVRGTASCSSKVNIEYGSVRNSASDQLFSADTWIFSTTGTTYAFDATAKDIDAGEWIWMTTSGLSGTVYDVNLTINYIKR